MHASSHSKFVLSQGDLLPQDIFSYIDKGVSHFFQVGFERPLKNFRAYDFSFTLSPCVYYKCSIVELLHYFLQKSKGISLSSMALTAFHEAISNALLWGLLKVKRPDDWFEFGRVIEEALQKASKSSRTLSFAVTTIPHVKVHIINPSDDGFDIDAFFTQNDHFPRGANIISLFSEISYDREQKNLSLVFQEGQHAIKAVSQP